MPTAASPRRAHGERYDPASSDAGGWVEFCVEAHLAQIERAASRWQRIEEIVASRGWPDRLAIALEQSLIASADRLTYSNEADVSAPTASGDFRRLLDADLVVQEGRGRSTRYRASDKLREVARERRNPEPPRSSSSAVIPG